MHPLDVHFKLLWLAKLSSTEIAQRTGSLGIRCTAVGPVHLQVIQSEKVFLTELTLVRSFAVVHFGCMLHNVLLAQHCNATHFAVVLADGETEGGIMEHRAVGAVVQRVLEFQVTATTIWKVLDSI